MPKETVQKKLQILYDKLRQNQIVTQPQTKIRHKYIRPPSVCPFVLQTETTSYVFWNCVDWNAPVKD